MSASDQIFGSHSTRAVPLVISALITGSAITLTTRLPAPMQLSKQQIMENQQYL
jgi:hypothetical protein